MDIPGQVEAIIELVVTRKDGTVRERREMKSESFVRQFLDLLIVQMEGVPWVQPLDVRDTGNALRQVTSGKLTFAANALTGDATFGIVAVDSSSNESAVPTLFQTTLGDPRLGGSILEVDPVFEGWPGTKVNCWVDEYKNLVIADTMTWDTMASFGVVSWDTWTSWAMAPYAQASYQHPEIDLGAVYTFTLLVSVVGTANITVEESHSTDGVSYTAYALTGELITARYVRLRITLEVPT